MRKKKYTHTDVDQFIKNAREIGRKQGREEVMKELVDQTVEFFANNDLIAHQKHSPSGLIFSMALAPNELLVSIHDGPSTTTVVFDNVVERFLKALTEYESANR